ncbi:MAG: helix-turn-helix domain-containing protein [Paracoccaceae bacterium]
MDGETCFDSEVDGPLTMTGQVGNAEIFAKMQRDIGQIFLEFSALGHFQLLGITGAQLLENAKAPHILNPALKPEMQKIMGAKDMATSTRIDVLADVLSQLPIHAVPDGMENAVKRMEAADGDIRLAELLAELGLAERQFRTEFKRIIGLTPKAFCKTLQINRALNHLLTSTKGDLASVAIETGFSDQAHFTRAFSKFLGKAPKGYLVDVEKTLSRFVGQSRPG